MKTKQPATIAPLLAEATDDQPVADHPAPSLLGSLSPIMHPDSLRRIEANYQAWLRERRAREQAESVEEGQR